MVCTELISSQAIHYKNHKTWQMFDWRPQESPFAVQLYGAEPAVMAEAARMVVDYGADIVDIKIWAVGFPKSLKRAVGLHF